MARGKRHTPEQIVNVLRQIEVAMANGKTTPLACKEAGITEQTYYRRRKEYGGLKVDQAKSAAGVVAWAYDEQGQPINPQGPSNFSPADCAGGGAPGVGPLSTALPDLVASLNRNLCSRNVYVTAELGAQSIQGTPVVVSIYLILGDKSLMFRDTVATKQYYDAKQQQQMKNAQQQKAPTL
jgi:Transposase